jgi:hypothetical protein
MLEITDNGQCIDVAAEGRSRNEFVFHANLNQGHGQRRAEAGNASAYRLRLRIGGVAPKQQHGEQAASKAGHHLPYCRSVDL